MCKGSKKGLYLLRASVYRWCMLMLFLGAEFAILCELKHGLQCTPPSRQPQRLLLMTWNSLAHSRQVATRRSPAW